MSAEPRVEDLLASIRKAIDSEESGQNVSMSGAERGTITRGSIRELKVEFPAKPQPVLPQPVHPAAAPKVVPTVVDAEPRKSELESLRNRVARANAKSGFAAPPVDMPQAPRFRVEPTRPQPTRGRVGPFSEILAAPLEVEPDAPEHSEPAPPYVPPVVVRPPHEAPPYVAMAHMRRRAQAQEAQPAEPPFLRRTQIEADYEDDIAIPDFARHVAPEVPQAVPYAAAEPEAYWDEPEAETHEELHDVHHEPVEPRPLPHQDRFAPPLQQQFVPPSPVRHQPQVNPPRPPQTALVSHETSHSARRSFDDLADAVFSRATNDRDLEDMTRDLLRGYLSRWLDEHLPEIVEKLVREEIERVARRGN